MPCYEKRASGPLIVSVFLWDFAARLFLPLGVFSEFSFISFILSDNQQVNRYYPSSILHLRGIFLHYPSWILHKRRFFLRVCFAAAVKRGRLR